MPWFDPSNSARLSDDNSIMAKFSKIRILFVLVGVGCLLIGTHGCRSEQAAAATPAPPVLSKLQNAFIIKHGSPDLFAVTFDGPRRIDTWIYFGSPQRLVVFDDGLFIEERELSDSLANERRTDLKPEDFSPGLAKTGITERFGQPDDQEQTTIEGKHLTIMRYEPQGTEPLKSFGFIDDELIAVTVGFNFASSE